MEVPEFMNKSLLEQLSAAQFACWETHLYMDTPPEDLQVLALNKKYQAKFDALKAKYEEKYGALTAADAQGVEWCQDPWPWENEGCGC